MPNYKINFSPKEKMSSIAEYAIVEGKLSLIRQEMNVRDVEIAMLQSLSECASNSYPDRKNVFMAADLAQRFANVADTEESIIIDESDNGFITQGFKETANKRSSAWPKCIEMLKQLNEMTPIQVQEKEKMTKIEEEKK
jgi:hypothetical protein